jgi:hypothetical protein
MFLSVLCSPDTLSACKKRRIARSEWHIAGKIDARSILLGKVKAKLIIKSPNDKKCSRMFTRRGL